METWKAISGYGGNYEVSDLGRVRRGERLKKATVGAQGYLVVGLWYKNKGDVKCVHSLVAEAFIGPRVGEMSVNHISGDKLDNTPANLEWMSLSENAKHAVVIGLSDTRGEKSPMAKLTEDQAKSIKARANSGERTCDLAAEFGVGSPIVSQIKNGSRWRHLE